MPPTEPVRSGERADAHEVDGVADARPAAQVQKAVHRPGPIDVGKAKQEPRETGLATQTSLGKRTAKQKQPFATDLSGMGNT